MTCCGRPQRVLPTPCGVIISTSCPQASWVLSKHGIFYAWWPSLTALKALKILSSVYAWKPPKVRLAIIWRGKNKDTSEAKEIENIPLWLIRTHEHSGVLIDRIVGKNELSHMVWHRQRDQTHRNQTVGGGAWWRKWWVRPLILTFLGNANICRKIRHRLSRFFASVSRLILTDLCLKRYLGGNNIILFSRTLQ